MPKIFVNNQEIVWGGNTITYEQVAEMINLVQPTVVVMYKVAKDHHLYGRDTTLSCGESAELVDGTRIEAVNTSGA